MNYNMDNFRNWVNFECCDIYYIMFWTKILKVDKNSPLCVILLRQTSGFLHDSGFHKSFKVVDRSLRFVLWKWETQGHTDLSPNISSLMSIQQRPLEKVYHWKNKGWNFFLLTLNLLFSPFPCQDIKVQQTVKYRREMELTQLILKCIKKLFLTCCSLLICWLVLTESCPVSETSPKPLCFLMTSPSPWPPGRSKVD